jgi:arsenite methyltransferase
VSRTKEDRLCRQDAPRTAVRPRGRASERIRALREAARVLKKGGKLAIADVRNTRTYAGELEACGRKITGRRSLGVRFWFAAGPWAATRLVAAIKP